MVVVDSGQASGESSGCPHCLTIKQTAAAKNHKLIYETPLAVVVAGDHQFFPGYCLVIAKRHVREMHDMPRVEALALFEDVLHVGRVIQASFECWKMNYVSLGNIHEHLHWHVIPRYQSDPDHREHPWKNAHLFSKYPTSMEAVELIKKRLQGPKSY